MDLIRRGTRGEDVRDVQHRLLAAGLRIDPDELDGAFGASTEEAVRGFQRARGLPPDGIMGPDTWGQLVEAGYRLSDRTLYLRSPAFRGDDVRALQRMLNALGFDAGKEDGIFGPRTDRAVREFQRNVASRVDGIVGLDTVHAISRYRPPVDAPSRAVVREGEAARGPASPSPVRSSPSNPTGSTRTRPTCHSRSPGSSPRRSSTWVLARCCCVRGPRSHPSTSGSGARTPVTPPP